MMQYVIRIDAPEGDEPFDCRTDDPQAYRSRVAELVKEALDDDNFDLSEEVLKDR